MRRVIPLPELAKQNILYSLASTPPPSEQPIIRRRAPRLLTTNHRTEPEILPTGMSESSPRREDEVVVIQVSSAGGLPWRYPRVLTPLPIYSIVSMHSLPIHSNIHPSIKFHLCLLCLSLSLFIFGLFQTKQSMDVEKVDEEDLGRPQGNEMDVMVMDAPIVEEQPPQAGPDQMAQVDYVPEDQLHPDPIPERDTWFEETVVRIKSAILSFVSLELFSMLP